jgi:16S rRNA (guanine527-N7)-methyltransferase
MIEEVIRSQFGMLIFEKVSAYAREILEINVSLNLTGIKDYETFLESCVYDSLCLLSSLPEGDKRLIDIGSGAGIPGFILKLARPDLRVSLLDATKKKLDAVEKIAEKFEVSDVNFIHGRAEDLGHSPDYRERYDYASAKAVAGLNSLLEYSVPFIKVGGIFLAMKGPKVREELEISANAHIKLGCEDQLSSISYTLPISGSERTLLIYKKLHHTPKAYPRSNKHIVSSPLN